MCAKCPVVRKLLRSPLSLHPNVDKVCLTHDRELLRLRHPAKRKSMSQSTYQMLKSLQIFHYLGNSAGKRKKQARVLDQSCFDSYAICTCYFENPYRDQKFGFINGVDNVNWPPYRDSRISVRWPIYIINSVDKTKFLYTTSPPTQHHSFFRNYPFILQRSVLIALELALKSILTQLNNGRKAFIMSQSLWFRMLCPLRQRSTKYKSFS